MLLWDVQSCIEINTLMPWLFPKALGRVVCCELPEISKAWLDEFPFCGKCQQPLQKEVHQGLWLEGSYCTDCDDFDFPPQLVAEGPLTCNSYFSTVTLE